MKYIISSITLIIACLLSTQVFAVKILECVDEAGNSSFQDRCPPGTEPVSEKVFYTGNQASDKGNPNISIALYTVPACDTCDLVRNLLNRYGANVTEINIKDDVNLQRELLEKTGSEGSLSIPTVIFGDQVIVGYKKQELIKSLEDAGFEIPDAETKSNTAEQTAENTTEQ